MNDERATPKLTAVVAVLVVFASSLLLPVAERQFWLGGRGFGTILAQTLFWNSARIYSKFTGRQFVHMTEVEYWRATVALNVVVFGLLLLVVILLARLIPRISVRWIVALTTIVYLGLLFIAPQATVGP
jgi:hypothetical protein